MNHKHKIIVISFDGLGSDDWTIIEKLPHFKAFLEEAAYCKTVETVYPSLTYPAHCTIATGRYPVHHRVIHNTLLQPGRMASPDWYWKRKYIKGKTIYEAAKEKGMKTAAFLWPVTAGANIDYHIPEIFANRKWDHQILASLRSGSVKLQAEVFARYGKLMHGIEQPYLDDFIHQSILYTLKKYEPDFTLIHYVDLDSMRHHYGHSSPEALKALKRHDQRLGELMDLLKGEPVTWVLLGDHSSLDEDKAIRLNRVLERAGWLKRDKKGNIQSYQVLMRGADGSAYLYGRPELAQQVQAELERFSREHDDCLEAIYSAEEAGRQGADDTCLFMLEAKKGYYFQDTLEGPDIYEIHPEECISTPHMQMATHGYSPKKEGYTTVFAMRNSGAEGAKQGKLPALAKGEVASYMHLADEGPTIAHLFGGVLPEADGMLRKEFFA